MKTCSKLKIARIVTLAALLVAAIVSCGRFQNSSQSKDVIMRDDARYIKNVVYSTPPAESVPALVHLRYCQHNTPADKLKRKCPSAKKEVTLNLVEDFAPKLHNALAKDEEVDQILYGLLESEHMVLTIKDPNHKIIMDIFKAAAAEQERREQAEARRIAEEERQRRAAAEADRRRRAAEEEERRLNNRFWNCSGTCYYQQRVIPLYGGNGSWDNENRKVFAGCRGRSSSGCNSDLADKCRQICNDSWYSMEWKGCSLSNISCR